MNCTKLLALLTLVLFTSQCRADIGFFGTYVFVDSGAGSAVYDLTPPGGTRFSDPTDFDGLDFGVFSPGDTLSLTGAEGLTFKNNFGDGNDVFGSLFNYSVVPVGDGHSFTEVSLPFGNNAPFSDAAGTTYSGGGDQRWGGDGSIGPVDFLSGLSEGMYEIQVFMRGTGNSSAGQFFHSNGGANFTATFSVIPEPASLVTFGIACSVLVRRRRA